VPEPCWRKPAVDVARYVAFLRAINVGGHTVKMADLRRSFEAMGFTTLETFIASGNVGFEAETSGDAALEDRIATALQADLGYRVDTFVRTPTELAAIAAHRPFGGLDVDSSGWRLFVVFVGTPPAPQLIDRLMALSSGIDEFEVRGREVYWLVRGHYSDSKLSGALLERTLGMPATVRGAPTVRKIAANYA
jgi:uncharacterized protein (DUF1697 family)